MDPFATYQTIVDEMVPDGAVIPAKWFGMPCLKHNGYVFVAYRHGDLIVKLRAADLTAALKLPGVDHFDPMDRGRPMREWLRIPPDHAEAWLGYARHAREYAAEQPPKG